MSFGLPSNAEYKLWLVAMGLRMGNITIRHCCSL